MYPVVQTELKYIHSAILRKTNVRCHRVQIGRDTPLPVFDALRRMVLTNRHGTTTHSTKATETITITKLEKVLSIFNAWASEDDSAPSRVDLFKKEFRSGSKALLQVDNGHDFKIVYRKNSARLFIYCHVKVWNQHGMPL